MTELDGRRHRDCGQSSIAASSGVSSAMITHDGWSAIAAPTHPKLPRRQVRFVLSWRLSNTLNGRFCLEALDAALRPEIFNTDQGVQFTARSFTGRLEAKGIAVIMDGRGRGLDNVFVERLRRSLKHENIYLKAYCIARELEAGLERWFAFYNHERLHQSLAYRTPPRSTMVPSRSGLERGERGQSTT
ncbi:Integrase core domain-containing protein [Singulisphaera sp. GP187]|nr:Integrase core domain-containing protein [Singulisphaera sp. GP187]